MTRHWLTVGCAALLLGAWGCGKKPADKADKGKGAAPAAMQTAGGTMAALSPARPARTVAKAPTAPGALAKVGGGLSDPDVVARALAVPVQPQLGGKGFTSGAATPSQLCTGFIGKLVSCKHMPAFAQPRQVALCVATAARNQAFKQRLGYLPRLSCGHLARIVKNPVRRGKTVKDGQGVGIITEKMLRQLGADMIEMGVAKYGKHEADSKMVQAICDQISTVMHRSGRGRHPQRCAAAKAPSFNATALGDHILFHSAAIRSLENLAIAQIGYAADLKKYLAYQVLLAAHVLLNRPLKEWPVPGCAKGDLTCRTTKLGDAKVQARFKGMMLAILAHEFGHNINNHARRQILRTEVLRVNAAQFTKLTKGKKAAFIDKLGSTALGQANEYEADETSIRILQGVWKETSATYQQTTGDALMGPQPMDIVYVALFMQGLSDAIGKLTGKQQPPNLIRSHPASHARADRGLRVIIANEYAGHKLARAAYSMLILRQRG